MKQNFETQRLALETSRKRIGLRLKQLAVYGSNPAGGIDRSFGSQADLEARGWLHNLWSHTIGLSAQVDAAANMWAQVPGQEELPPIVFGSHHDTVANGGAYDGAAGVILATEVAECLLENKIRLRHPFMVVSFTGEEPNPFGLSTLGSKLVVGKLHAEELADTVSRETGESLAEALKNAGGDFAHLQEVKRAPGSVAAFVECHIEQGSVLEKQNLALGVVQQVTGIYRENIHILGDANHAGTTLLPDRHDALLAASEVALALEEVVAKSGHANLVGTVGRMVVRPNSTNIIPGDVELILEIRTPDKQALEEALHELAPRLRAVIEKRGVHIVRHVLSNQSVVPMNQQVRTILETASQSLGEQCPALTSMAGHDAAHMASITRSGMLFVRTPNGHSHCPREQANLDDLKKAGDALLKTALLLDKELD